MRSKFSLILFVHCFFIASQLSAQSEAQKWYFGANAGLDFSTNPPAVLTNGAMYAFEGCATICDNAGNLLFYTNGIVVYNQAHLVMDNGVGLMGNMSSTQSAIIVKIPGSASRYYIFTVDQFADPNGLRYSEVDMSLSAGMGSVTVQNVPLYTPSCEKLTAIRHCNGTDVWVLSHDYNSSDFRAYLVTAAGINTVPVISTAGNQVSGLGFMGQMKASQNGTKIGFMYATNPSPSPVQIFDFDPSSGVVSNPLSLASYTNNYGCEFSPDGTKFYTAREFDDEIIQWDLCAGNAAAILSSSIAISTSTENIASFQLAPDGKIYIARPFTDFLSVINFPNQSGAACGFVNAGQSVSTASSSYGLPNYITGTFKPALAPFSSTVSCNTASFDLPSGCSMIGNAPASVQWNFGDPASGAANSSTLQSPVHLFSATGTYSVELVRVFACSTETVVVPVTILNMAPTLSLSGNFSICSGQQRIYTASGANTYSWSSGPVTSTVSLSPTITSTYSVTGTGTNSCSGSRIFTVTVSKCTGIDDESSPASVIIYPNPAGAKMFIETGTPLLLKILDGTGQAVAEKQVETGKSELDIRTLKSGVYTISYFIREEHRKIKLVKIE